MKPTTANLLLALLSFTATVALALGALKLLQPRLSQTELADLSLDDRRRLAEEILDVGGTGYEAALYEPAVGYTLKPSSELSLWGDTFTSNELGFRAGPARKPEGVFRVVFLGDSWTYGMGVAQSEAFPERLAALANRMMPGDAEVEAWPVALPGYNTLNQVAALEIFFDRLQPDAVVLCPTRNDNDSSFVPSPTGMPRRPSGDYSDRFGNDHWLSFQSRFLSSFLWRQRWGQSFSAIRQTERWLADRNVPLFLFFVAYWDPAIVHDFVRESDIRAPYLILPRKMVGGQWSLPAPWYHGTPAAYEIFARMLYRGLAVDLGWPPLDLDPEKDPHPAEAFRQVPPGDWRRSAREVALEGSREVPTRFVPGDKPLSCAGAMDCATGLMGRRTTILVRRTRRARRLAIEVERIAEPTRLYPLLLTASIPAPGGGTESSTTVPAEGPKRHRFLLDLPAEVEPGEILEVQLRAERATLPPGQRALRSLHVVRIEQES